MSSSAMDTSPLEMLLNSNGGLSEQQATELREHVNNVEKLNAWMEREMVDNAAISRAELWRNFFDQRRDVDDECGYPKTPSLTAKHYRLMYEREAIAERVVNLWPTETWLVSPEVYENEEEGANPTQFEQEWQNLNKALRGANWYAGTDSAPVWEYMQRADILTGVGHYGVMLLGLNDGKQLNEPADGLDDFGNRKSNSSGKTRELTFLRVFDESLAEITQFEQNVFSARYGQPNMYRLSFSDPTDRTSGRGVPMTSLDVHWTRVLHFADNLSSSEIFGVPRQRPVYNRLYDLRKMYGGSAEMFWKGAFMGLQFSTHPSLGGDVEVDRAALRSSVEDYQNKLQRFLLAKGGEWKSLAPQVADPTPHIKALLEAIAIQLRVPMRIFLGSERGELASTQDESAWLGRVMGRQMTYVTPRMIVPFVNRLIALGVLPVPGGDGWYCKWPDLDALSEEEKVNIALKRTQAIASFVGGDVEAVFPLMEYYTLVHGYSTETAEVLVEAAKQQMEEETRISTDPMDQFTEDDDEEATDKGGSKGDGGDTDKKSDKEKAKGGNKGEK